MIAVIAIGDEILSGHTVNRNAAVISRALGKIGLQVTRHEVISDNRIEIKERISKALESHRVVITTGGLGPTFDDNSRKGVAELFECGFRYDEEVASKLEARYQGLVPSLKDQATIPEKARPFHNKVGTAPGLLFEEGEKVLIMLPGVPVEMRSLLTCDVLPYLEAHFEKEKEILETLHFFQIKEVDVDAILRRLGTKYPKVKMGIYPSLGVVTVRLSTIDDPKGLLAFKQEIEKACPDHLFASPDGTLDGAVHEICSRKKITLATAESCSGGMIASSITSHSGASDYFLGGIVAYSNFLKETLLGVEKAALDRYGAVSKEVVEAMCLGAIKQTGCDYGVAVSGIAGPTGGTAEKPVGTVWVAVGKKGKKPIASLLKATGDREAITIRSVHHALGELLKLIR